MFGWGVVYYSKTLLTLFCRLFGIVLGPSYHFRLRHHILHWGGRDTIGLFSAELHVTIIGIITKLSPAEVAGLIAVFGGAFSRLLLLQSWLGSCWDLHNVTLILPDLIYGVKDLLGFTLNFLAYLQYKEILETNRTFVTLDIPSWVSAIRMGITNIVLQEEDGGTQRNV